MKKNKIIALTAGTFMALVSVLTIVSCNKEEQQVNSPTPGKTSKISGVVDLENFSTQFVNNPGGSQTITFSEAEDIPFLPQDAHKLGF